MGIKPLFAAATLVVTTAAVFAAPADPPDPKLRLALARALSDTHDGGDLYDAHVWVTDMSHRLSKRFPDEYARLEFLKHIHIEAKRAKLPPEMVLAVIEVESNFNQFAISRAGAQGYMQVMPFWLKEIGRPNDNLFRLTTNLRMGCTILRHYHDLEGGNWTRALARYNGSLGKNKYPYKVFEALRTRWSVQ
jgi:soluble lytic murein transglycosylase-like protein